MTQKSVIIIGAGLAGLSAGCYAQMNGYRSRIFEHHSEPGGVVACWTRKGYLVDGGIHFYMGHRPGTGLYDLYRELGAVQSHGFLDMTVYGRFTDEASGRSVLVTRDLSRLAADLKAQAPEDCRTVDALIAGARAMQGLDMSEVGMGKPPELSSLLGQLKQYWGMRRLLRYMAGPYAKPVAEYVRDLRDPWLRECLKGMFLPEVPVWFLLMLLALLADGQIGLLDGASGDFVRSIEERYKALGGQVAYKATVEEILVEGSRAVGVRLADGSEHRADAVISAADGRSTLFELLGGRYVDAKTEQRYREWPLIRPTVTVSLGVAQTFPDEPWMSIVMLEQPLTVGAEVVRGLAVRIFNYSQRFAPPGKTVVQVSFETGWDFWSRLREDMPRYRAEKERVAAEVLERLEAHYPGIASQVEMIDVATPYTTWRYTRNYRGAYMGWLPTPKALTTQIGRTLPGLDGFYMAGQWVMPGGGVPPTLYSGRHAVELLCHHDGKPFVTASP